MTLFEWTSSLYGVYGQIGIFSLRPSSSMNGLVRLSVRPSVCLSVTLFHYVLIIVSSWNFQVLLPMRAVMSMQNTRSEVKVESHNGQFTRFRTITLVWIHIWWWNDAQSLMLLRRGALLFFKFIPQIAQSLKQLRNGALLFMQDAHQMSRSHGTNVTDFDPNWVFPDCNSSLNLPMALKWCIQLDVL